MIAGHTDSVGSSKYNMGLSSQRAMAVLDFLKSHFKIADKRLVVVGYGEERLKNSADSMAAENRRVEFITLVR
ncbi:MAG: OmpA family protein [bacterium]|nr:OmpA family protein [bacterium]